MLRLALHLHSHLRLSSAIARNMSLTPKVISIRDLPTSEAKWISLKQIKYSDAAGKERFWESAERRTRNSGGIDAVAILALLRSKTNAFPLSTVIIEQYRPPIDKFIIELPAGLIDKGETPEQAALRELTEETGYVADSIVESTPVVVSDPGMTNANMKLVILKVTMADVLQLPEQKLDAGEFIVRRVVELAQLRDELKAYNDKGFIVDAKLSHFAEGYAIAQRIKNDEL